MYIEASDTKAPWQKTWIDLLAASTQEEQRIETLSALFTLVTNLESGKTTTMTITDKSGKSYPALTASVALANEYYSQKTPFAIRKIQSCITIIQRLLNRVPLGDRAATHREVREKLPDSWRSSI